MTRPDLSLDRLIADLAQDLSPVRRGLMVRRLLQGIAVGAAVTAVLVLVRWGVRPDAARAPMMMSFWVKFVFAGGLAAAGFAATVRLARPGGAGDRGFAAAVAVALVMAALAALQLARSAPEAWRNLTMGQTAAVCPWLIMLLSVPVFAGTIWALRKTAPTRLRQAGAAAGLTAGAVSAFLYALSCDETAMPFVFVWYGLAIILTTAIGAAAGPRLLRW